jgi:hypothetical protein
LIRKGKAAALPILNTSTHRFVESSRSRTFPSLTPACEALGELLYFDSGELFASESMKAIQGYQRERFNPFRLLMLAG